MLAAAHRLRDSREFAAVVRRGRRVATPAVVVHVVTGYAGAGSNDPGTDGAASVGLVVSKAVGPAVVRNRVKRRLRHLMRDRVGVLAPGTRLVLRARPESATLSSAQLASQLDGALRRAGLSTGGDAR